MHTYRYIFDVDSTLYQIPPEIFNDWQLNTGMLYEHIHFNRELYVLLRDIKNKYIMSNGSRHHVDTVLRKMKLRELFPNHTVTCYEDFSPRIKPNIYAYYASLKLLGIPNENIIFFEDNRANLHTAKYKFGWITVLILPNLSNKPEYVDYIFPNITQALTYFKNLTRDV